jgi:hypothetical protein
MTDAFDRFAISRRDLAKQEENLSVSIPVNMMCSLTVPIVKQEKAIKNSDPFLT